MTRWLGSVLFAALVLAAPAVKAFTPTCPSPGLLGTALASSMCFSCFFPIRIGPVPPFPTMVPATAAPSPVCVCPGRFGIPTPGITVGMWAPMRLVETTQTPFCSPSLGVDLGGALASSGLLYGKRRSNSDLGASFWNGHVLAFPLGAVLDIVQWAVCPMDLPTDMDLLYLTELDPSWQLDALATVLAPETLLYANPIAQAACAADAVAATATQPLPLLHWCAGAWGSIYPLSGNIPHDSSFAASSSAGSAKVMAMMHRRLLARRSAGVGAVCANPPWPTLPRNQYKVQQLWPFPEVTSNHWIGSSPWRWGEWRNPPVGGDNRSYLYWRWDDCCANL